MAFVVQRILALVAAVTLAAGGSLCRCAAAAATPSSRVSQHQSAECSPTATTNTAGQVGHACCEHPASASATPSGATPAGRHPPAHVPPGGDPAGHCERCTAQVSTAPDVPANAPSAELVDVFLPAADRSTDLLAPPAGHLCPTVAESPPPRDQLTLLALGCSLLD